MSWDYAELSKAAKRAGSPEKLIDQLVDSGRKDMTPWLVVAVGAGATMTVVVQKVSKYLRARKQISDLEVEKAKTELIKGIKHYDDEQEKQHNVENQK